MGSMNLAFDTSSTLGQNVYAGRELESASICVAVARSSAAVNALERHQSVAGRHPGPLFGGWLPGGSSAVTRSRKQHPPRKRIFESSAYSI